MAAQPRTRRRPATIVVAGAVAAVLAFLVPLELSGGSVTVGERCAGAATAQATVNIGMVVDFGDTKDVGDPGRIQVTCVGVGAGANGVAMLQAAGHAVGMDSSGLLCSIDGLPADWRPGTRCGDRTATGYRYWAYFHGTGSSWAYSSIGPAGYRAAEGTVEGWHFVEGAGNPSDPPPGRAPTNICPTAPPPTVAPTTAPPPPPTPAPTAPVTPAPAQPGAAGPTTGPGGAAPTTGAPTTTAPGTPGEVGADPAGDAAGAAGDGAPPGTDGGSGSAPGTTTIGADGVASDVTVLASAQAPPPGPGGAAPLATVVAIAGVAALGVAAAWRFRRRSDATV